MRTGPYQGTGSLPSSCQHRATTQETILMDVLVMPLLFILGLVIFDLLALRYGVDSRPGIGDDHAQRIGSGRFSIR